LRRGGAAQLREGGQDENSQARRGRRDRRSGVLDGVDRSGQRPWRLLGFAVAGGGGGGRRRRRHDQRRLYLAYAVPRAEQPGGDDLDLPAVCRHGVRRARQQVPLSAVW